MSILLEPALRAVGDAVTSGMRVHDVRQSPAFRELNAAIRSDARIAPLLNKSVGVGFGAQQLTADDIAMRCLRSLEAAPSVAALVATFDATFPAKTLLVELSLPLHGFSGPARMTITDRLEIVEVPSLVRGDDRLPPATHMLRRTLRLPLVVDGGSPLPESAAMYAAAREDLWIAMRALHVVGAGVCYGERIGVDIGGPLIGLRTGKSPREWRMATDLPSNRFALTDVEVPGAREVLQWCIEEPARTLLRIPLRRLHSSLRRSRDEDRLRDLMVALQALLLPEYDTELSLRFAVRGSELLGTSLGERQEIFLRLHAAYGRHNPRMHEGVVDASPASVDVLTDDLRRCIRFCAERMSATHESLTSFIPDLEADLLGSARGAAGATKIATDTLAAAVATKIIEGDAKGEAP